MARSTVKLYKNFDVVNDEIKRLARAGLEAAADQALETINGEWPHGGFHTERVEGTVDGFKSGVSAQYDKKHIAHFHDHGTLGSFRRGSRTEPKRPRKRKYSMTRKDGSPTGIRAKRFYGKGRAAGKRALLRKLGI